MYKLIFTSTALLFSNLVFGAVVCVSMLPKYQSDLGYCGRANTVAEARNIAQQGGFFSGMSPETTAVRITCEKTGWYSYIFKPNSKTVGLTCGQSTKVEALKTAFKSCASKGDCIRPEWIFVGRDIDGQAKETTLCGLNGPNDPFNPNAYETLGGETWRGKGDMPICTDLIRFMQ